MKLPFSLFFFLIFGFTLLAQSDYYRTDFVRYENFEYLPSIKTVKLHPEGAETALPILELGKNDRLLLSFDDLTAQQRNLGYSIEHCNSDWKPSGWAYGFCVQGPEWEMITDFEYSFNTLQQYIHYRAKVPSELMTIRISGNYLLRVFEDNNVEKPLLTQRFYVNANQVSVEGRISRPAQGSIRDTHQEVDFVVNVGGLKGQFAQNQFRVMVMQNGRWDQVMNDLKPIYVRQNTMSFDYDDGTIVFPGYNEFRSADVRSFRLNSQSVQRIINDSTLRIAELLVDKPRLFTSYSLWPDFNGRFVIRTFEGETGDTDGDYLKVNFYLQADPSFAHMPVFLVGPFNHWRYDSNSRMQYLPEKQLFTKQLLLKQGIYSYCYAFNPASNGLFEPFLLEGSHFQTENDYYVFIYNRAFGSVYDELVGVRRINTLKN